MGRPPKPTALLKIEKGKLYSDQRDRAALEPKSKKELKPRCPKRYNRDERREWRYIKSILENYGLFTIANAVHMDLLATALAKYKNCTTWDEQNKVRIEIHRCLNGLGLGSVGLARIGQYALKAKKQKNEEDFLS